MGEGKPRNTLRVLSGPLAGATFEVGTRVLIGRVPACDIVLADVEVSREHAMIISDAGKPTLVDLGSCNGTFMDGKRVGRAGLVAGSTFAISNSKFVFDKAPPISTRPVLAAQFGIAGGVRLEASDAMPTQETPAVFGPAVTSDQRPTRRALEAAGSSEMAPPTSGRPTVRLEAATADPADEGRPTLKLHAVGGEGEASATRTTTSLGSVEPADEGPLTFAPPPTPMPKKPTAAERPKPARPVASPKDVYRGDLLADITDYRWFRLRLQRGEIPTGEEVAAMIDLEAMLREPPAESSLYRDVVTNRFFRRFPFSAALCARFTSSGDVFEAKGMATNLSVDGLRCSLELGDFTPERNQLAMLVLDHTRGFLDVRYSITARVVYCRKGMAGFVFAGVPSWAERGEFQHVETAVRARLEPK